MHAQEVVHRYSAEPAVFQHKALMISVNRSFAEKSLYDATRYAWKLNPAKAKQADVILATVQSLIVGAFVADEWLGVNRENFLVPEEASTWGRYGFVGREAPGELQQMYVGKRVPDEYRKHGAANPIKYSWHS